MTPEAIDDTRLLANSVLREVLGSARTALIGIPNVETEAIPKGSVLSHPGTTWEQEFAAYAEGLPLPANSPHASIGGSISEGLSARQTGNLKDSDAPTSAPFTELEQGRVWGAAEIPQFGPKGSFATPMDTGRSRALAALTATSGAIDLRTLRTRLEEPASTSARPSTTIHREERNHVIHAIPPSVSLHEQEQAHSIAIAKTYMIFDSRADVAQGTESAIALPVQSSQLIDGGVTEGNVASVSNSLLASASGNWPIRTILSEDPAATPPGSPSRLHDGEALQMALARSQGSENSARSHSVAEAIQIASTNANSKGGNEAVSGPVAFPIPRSSEGSEDQSSFRGSRSDAEPSPLALGGANLSAVSASGAPSGLGVTFQARLVSPQPSRAELNRPTEEQYASSSAPGLSRKSESALLDADTETDDGAEKSIGASARFIGSNFIARRLAIAGQGEQTSSHPNSISVSQRDAFAAASPTGILLSGGTTSAINALKEDKPMTGLLRNGKNFGSFSKTLPGDSFRDSDAALSLAAASFGVLNSPASLSGSTLSSNISANRQDIGIESANPFPAMDGEGKATTASSRMRGVADLQVGYHDPVLGYVELRAHGANAEIHASLEPQSSVAGESLEGQLSALSVWMKERHTPVESLTVLSPGASLDATENMGGHSAMNCSSDSRSSYPEASGQREGTKSGSDDAGQKDVEMETEARSVTATGMDTAASSDSISRFVQDKSGKLGEAFNVDSVLAHVPTRHSIFSVMA